MEGEEKSLTSFYDDYDHDHDILNRNSNANNTIYDNYLQEEEEREEEEEYFYYVIYPSTLLSNTSFSSSFPLPQLPIRKKEAEDHMNDVVPSINHQS